MLRAILGANPDLVPAFLVLAVLFGIAAWRLSRGRTPTWATILFGISLAAELTATLFPTGKHAAASHVCYYSYDFAAAFGDQQGLMNVAMYVPLGLFGVLALRKPLAVVAGCLLLSATTETLQALIPHIGRACDSQDFVTNSVGAIVGVGAAYLWISARQRFLIPTRREAVWAVAPLAVGAVALAIVQRGVIQPQWEDTPLTDSHSSAQEALANRDAVALLGTHTKVVRVQDQAALAQVPELLLVTTETGSFSIEWPSGQLNQGTLGFQPLPSTGGSDGEARATADAFARRWFPRDAAGATSKVFKIDPTKARRIVEYRRYRPSDGMLEPMRLDIEVDPGGHVVQFTSRNVPDPAVPAAKVSRPQALAVAAKRNPGPVQAAFLLAQQEDGQWRPCWAVTVGTAGSPGTPVVIDAVSGRVLPPST
ncbi:VanZ family protein [Streptantibioticus parmotrematis]|uniref:VanZ family protein n=1 Tax=Streptantibioticus parmotrematis TaxID=2873249 RepID=UPI0033F0405A